jgi:hypothetical protein
MGTASQAVRQLSSCTLGTSGPLGNGCQRWQPRDGPDQIILLERANWLGCINGLWTASWEGVVNSYGKGRRLLWFCAFNLNSWQSNCNGWTLRITHSIG